MGLLDDLGSALYGAAGSANRFMDDPIGQVKGLLQQRMQEWADSAAANTQAAQMAMSNGPAMQDVGFQKMLDATVNHGGLLAPTVYHGTPHNIQGTYDLSKIGTGEGAQAYGYGMYFAENPKTAEAYRNILSKPEVVDQAGNSLTDTPGTVANQAAAWAETVAKEKDPFSAAMKLIRDTWTGEDVNQNLKQAVYDKLAEWHGSGAKLTNTGNLYSQYLPDEVLPKMLQWDKPLSEQPEAVQRAITKHLEDTGVYGVDITKPISGLRTGGEALAGISSTQGGQQAAAEYLQSLGIPGLSYLDAGSRAGGKGTMNHVIWDQGLLNQMIPTPVK